MEVAVVIVYIAIFVVGGVLCYYLIVGLTGPPRVDRVSAPSPLPPDSQDADAVMSALRGTLETEGFDCEDNVNIVPGAKAEGFKCERDVGIGGIKANLLATKKFKLTYASMNLHCYLFSPSVFDSEDRKGRINMIHRAAKLHTKKNVKGFFRYPPATVSVFLSTSPFDEKVIEYIRSRKLEKQFAHFNIVVLVDVSAKRVYALEKFGFFGRLPLKQLNDFVCGLLEDSGFDRRGK